MRTRQHNVTLDGLRGIAALAVLCFHTTGELGLPPYLPAHGYLAVDFFFMLSGLVVATAYEERLLADRLDFWQFAKIRLIRLYPLIALSTLFGFISLAGHIHHLQATGSHDPQIVATYPALSISLLLGLLILPFGPLSSSLMPLNEPLWSIFFEVCINFFYAATVRFLTRTLFAVIIAGSCGFVIIEAIHFHSIDFGELKSNLLPGFARVSVSFFIGVALARLNKRGMFNRVPKISGIVLAVVLVASFLPKAAHWGAVYDLASVLVLFPLIIILGLSDTLPDRARPVAAIAGRLSYPVYALHKPMIDHLTALHHFHGDARLIALVEIIAAVVVGSYAATRLYDEPVRAWLGSWARRGGGAAVAAAGVK